MTAEATKSNYVQLNIGALYYFLPNFNASMKTVEDSMVYLSCGNEVYNKHFVTWRISKNI